MRTQIILLAILIAVVSAKGDSSYQRFTENIKKEANDFVGDVKDAATKLKEKFLNPEDARQAGKDDFSVFKTFISTFQKEYRDDADKFSKKYSTFKRNLQDIIKRNSKGNGEYGVTAFTDIEPEEFVKLYASNTAIGAAKVSTSTKEKLAKAFDKAKGLFKKVTDSIGKYFKKNKVESTSAEAASKAATLLAKRKDTSSLNWVQLGAVTSVKNQGQCGSCWTFASVATMEGQYFIKTGKLKEFSQQQLVDCDTTTMYGVTNKGCNGGFPLGTAEYLKTNGIMLASDYPYKGVVGKCKYDAKKAVVKTTAGKFLSTEDELMTAIQEGPVAIAIWVGSDLQNWKKGVFVDSKGQCKGSVNHAVTAVGYGVENGTKYWLIKNSWGTYWGEKGYFKLERGVNRCGVQKQNSQFLIDMN